jgi:hypothetical protein
MRNNRRALAVAKYSAILLAAQAAVLAANNLVFAVGPTGVDDPVTFTKDIARILQVKCQDCHQPDSIGPMPLMTYDEVRPYVAMIRKEVSDQRMPPWHIDKTRGIQHFKNDRSLTDDELATMLRWIDDGAPMGDPADMPPPREFADPTQWQMRDQFGEPDLILRSTPYTVAELGQDKWWRPVVETGITEPRWVRAIEVKPSYPGGRQAVHHVMGYLIQEETEYEGLPRNLPRRQRRAGTFMEYAIGKVGEVFTEDTGKLLLPGSAIQFEVHYYAYGEPVTDDVVEMGIWFYPREHRPKYRTVMRMIGEGSSEGRLEIPPGTISMIQHEMVLPVPARLLNFQPHMHMRGKAQSLEAIYPDGRRELLAHADNFQWNWQVNYIFEDEFAPLLPAGTTLMVTSWHDNTVDNPHNPDPENWVGYGDRTVDEMAHVWLNLTFMEQEDFDQEVARREAAAAGE